MKVQLLYSMLMAASLFTSCDYLDLVPDNIPTMDMVFTTRQNAEKMLTTCYNYVPDYASESANPGLSSGDEIWNSAEKTYYYSNNTSFSIAKGNQNVNDPYLNYWSGGKSGHNMFVAIRDCNTFIENIDQVPDMTAGEKSRWKAEAKVLKAFFHYWLFQLYGPIPFVEKNIDVAASTEEMKVVREPADQVVAKIVALLDDATKDESLPMSIRIGDTELGRLTKPAALAIKAKVLTLAASPLFNGNPDFADFKNAEGDFLINPTLDPAKWIAARDACKAAIDAAHEGGHALYEFNDMMTEEISDTTKLELTLRASLTTRFSKELVWGIGDKSTGWLMSVANPPLTPYQQGKEIPSTISMHSPTMEVVEQFYSNKGIPIDEDITWDYPNRYRVEAVPANHEYYIEEKARTANLHYNREPRFYAFIGFDRGKWFNLEASNDKNSFIVRNKAGETSGRALDNYSITGYFAKKLINYKLVIKQGTNTKATSTYAFPIVRMSDLYLMYAEALNESKGAPDAEVYDYIQKVRDRAGLDKETGSLSATWERYSKNKNKPKTQVGMREIIQRERMIELAFEGQRFFDLRRWRLCMDYFNRPVRGWNVSESTEEGYYQMKYIFFKKFTPRDYFWPIKLSDIYINKKLQQSPFWEN